MNDSTSYFEKLRDPRWQKLRLKVFEREDWTCEKCGSTKKTLTIHHTYYEFKLEPWEYPQHSLRCLCEDCHKEAQATQLSLKRLLGHLSLEDIEYVLGFAMGLFLDNGDGRQVNIPEQYFQHPEDCEWIVNGLERSLRIPDYAIHEWLLDHNGSIQSKHINKIESRYDQKYSKES